MDDKDRPTFQDAHDAWYEYSQNDPLRGCRGIIVAAIAGWMIIGIALFLWLGSK